MCRAFLRATLFAGAGLLGQATGAWAQEALPRDAPPPGTGDVPQAASPAGAQYIPGVGFRYVTPFGARVYGWYYSPRVYGWYDDRELRRYQRGYRARTVACGGRDAWLRCARRWR